MSVAVIIPHRPVDEHRAAAFETVTSWWALACPEFRVVPVDDGGEPFSRAGSVNQGVERSDAEVLIVADGDVLLSRDQALWAVALAVASPGLVQPFDEMRWYGPDATRLLLEEPWRAFDGTAPPAEQTFFPSPTVPLLGACNVLSRRTWDAVGGFDPRFRGWGCEDIAFAQVCAEVAPTRRVPGPLMHLYHPKTGDYVSDRTLARNAALLGGQDAP